MERKSMHWVDRIGRRLKLRDLHTLMIVVRSGTMARAAQELAVSQPVVSKTISDLEHTLGVPLLDRSRNGVEPTLYGRALLKHGVTVFDELRQSVEEITFLSDPTVGELRIGCTDPMTAGLLPAIISRLHRQYPKLVFQTTQAASGPALYRELRERNVELILGRSTMPLAEPDLAMELLLDEPLVLVAGSQSQWQRRRKIEFADLINEPWILPLPNTAASAIITDTFQACGLKPPQGAVLTTSLQMHSILLASGPYLAMWPWSVTRLGAKNPSVKVLPVKLPVIRRPVGIITLKGRTNSPLVELFIDYARKAAKQLEG
jgi:DNA-binding transcriptional LysR family regulator